MFSGRRKPVVKSVKAPIPKPLSPKLGKGCPKALASTSSSQKWSVGDSDKENFQPANQEQAEPENRCSSSPFLYDRNYGRPPQEPCEPREKIPRIGDENVGERISQAMNTVYQEQEDTTNYSANGRFHILLSTYVLTA